MSNPKMPWLDQRANGWFYAFWPGEKRTERLSLRTKDVEKAKVRFATFLVEGRDIYENNKDANVAAKSFTVAMALEKRFLEVTRQGHSETTVARVASSNKFLTNIIGDVPIIDIKRSHINHYISTRKRDHGCGDGTLRRDLISLQSSVRYAAKEGCIPSDQVPTIHLPKDSPPRDRWLTKEELRSLLKASLSTINSWEETLGRRLSRCYRFVMLAYYTGGRRRALETLRWDQVKFDEDRIYLNPKGRRQNGKRRATVPISPRLRPMLKRAYRERTSEWVLDKPDEIYFHFAKARDAAGLQDITIHTLRHTRASHLLQDGKDVFAVAGLLGDNVNTVIRVYGHHCPGHLRDLVDGD